MFYIDMLVRLLIKLGLLKGTKSINLGKANLELPLSRAFPKHTLWP